MFVLVIVHGASCFALELAIFAFQHFIVVNQALVFFEITGFVRPVFTHVAFYVLDSLVKIHMSLKNVLVMSFI